MRAQEFIIYSVLLESTKSLAVNEIAELTMLPVQTVQELLKSLLKKGCIESLQSISANGIRRKYSVNTIRVVFREN